jgi:hypothetical protein
MAKEGDESDNLSLSYGDYGQAFRRPEKIDESIWESPN